MKTDIQFNNYLRRDGLWRWMNDADEYAYDDDGDYDDHDDNQNITQQWGASRS